VNKGEWSYDSTAETMKDSDLFVVSEVNWVSYTFDRDRREEFTGHADIVSLMNFLIAESSSW
jgi:hypothetical protein